MGLFGRIYQQGQARSVSAEVGAEPVAEDPEYQEYRRTVTPIRPGQPVARPVEKKGASSFAWAILGVFGLFGAGYLASSLKPHPVPRSDDENEG